MSHKREGKNSPAPMLGMTKGKQHSTGSIAIHFNAASLMEEDEDDDVLMDTSRLSSSKESAVHFSIGGSDSSKKESASAPSSGSGTPIAPHKQLAGTSNENTSTSDENNLKSDGEKSILSGLKERFNDPLFTSIIGKIETFSNETGLSERLKRSDSLDSNRSGLSMVGSARIKRDISSSEVGIVRSRLSSVDSYTDISVTEIPERSETGMPKMNSFETAENLHAEPAEVLNEKPIPHSFSSPQKLMSPPPSSSDAVNEYETEVVSMSSILSKNIGSDLDDELVAEEGEEAVEFFDPNDEDTAAPVQVAQPVVLPPSPPQNSHYHLVEGIPFHHKILCGLVMIIAYIIIPLPTYVSGMVLGSLLSVSGLLLYQWWTRPSCERLPLVLANLSSLPPLAVPEMKESVHEDGIFKGWMHELSTYNPESYSITKTKSVLVQLEGTKLRLQTPKQPVPKRAMWNEPQRHMVTFKSQRFVDVLNAKVTLLPGGLCRKRLWSKKYPICVALKVDDEKCLSVSDTSGLVQRGHSPCKDRISKGEAQTNTNTNTLYLFARTDRDKEEWYRRFLSAAEGLPLHTKMIDLLPKLDERFAVQPITNTHIRHGSTDSNNSDLGEEVEIPAPKTHQDVTVEYIRYMSRVMPVTDVNKLKAAYKKKFGKSAEPVGEGLLPPIVTEPPYLWFNAFVSRLFWDFLREEYFAEKVKDKIQKKLSKIHVPYFIDELTVTDIVLGKEVPIIRRVSKPYIDDRGLWIDMDISYMGGFQMSLETKVNLMKLKKADLSTEPLQYTPQHKGEHKRSAITDSDEEDSAESSSEEEETESDKSEVDEKTPQKSLGGGNTSRKIVRIVDKIANSKYFQKATEYKYIKKAMEEISNTNLELSVELRHCVGTMAINIPSPPTDRIWYGFRHNPDMSICAKPKVGTRAVTVTHITEWIEKKLLGEFQRILVFPNMDDVPIPLMVDHQVPLFTSTNTENTA